MKIHIITGFPESFESYFASSMMKKAIEQGAFEPIFYDLKNYTTDNKRIDDKAYGTHGQVLRAEPIAKAINDIQNKTGKKLKILYFSPGGERLNHNFLENIGNYFLDDFIIICGHYEGIDQRIIDKYVDKQISIGDFIISSGELASMVFIDSLVRLIPGVLGNTDSFLEESFSSRLEGKKEYPHYTRPRIFEEMEVPEILVSGHHANINKWKFNNLK